MTNSEKVKKAWLKRIQTHQYSLDLEKLRIVDSPEAAYTLGLLWADGHVFLSSRAGGISIECVSDDIDDFETILQRVGNWNRYYRTRLNRRPQSTLAISHKPLAEYLTTIGYRSKNDSHEKVLRTIPQKLQAYWLRGFFDGDGCVYIGKQVCVSFSAPYEQDWSALEALLNAENIRTKIQRRTHSNSEHKHSELTIRDKNSIKNFIEFCYQDRNFPSLKRKAIKCLSLV